MHELHRLFEQRIRQHFGDARVTHADLLLALEGNTARVTGHVPDRSVATMLLNDLCDQAPTID